MRERGHRKGKQRALAEEYGTSVSSLITEPHLPHREYFEDQVRASTRLKNIKYSANSISGPQGWSIFHSEMHITAF